MSYLKHSVQYILRSYTYEIYKLENGLKDAVLRKLPGTNCRQDRKPHNATEYLKYLGERAKRAGVSLHDMQEFDMYEECKLLGYECDSDY